MDEQPMPSTSKGVHIRDLEKAMRNAVMMMTSDDNQESAMEQCPNASAQKEFQDVDMEVMGEKSQDQECLDEQPQKNPKTAARKDLEAFLQEMWTRKGKLCVSLHTVDTNQHPQDPETMKTPVYKIVNDEKVFSPSAARKFKY
ncbi:unnamed protein product [Diamesa serratosioi]